MAHKLLDAAAATGVSSSIKVGSRPSSHTVAATMGGTAVATSVTLDLEGSLDDSNWFTLASHVFTAGEITAEQAMFHVADKPVTFARLNLSTLGGGTDPTVTAWYEPGDFVTP